MNQGLDGNFAHARDTRLGLPLGPGELVTCHHFGISIVEVR
jgi:hypothetical protein